MFVGPTAERPVEFAVGLGYRMLVDTGDAALHQSVRIKLPVLVAISPEPLSAVVMIFIGETNCDTIVGVGPHFFNQPIVKLARPFAGQEGLDLGAAANEFGAIPPL